MEPDHLSGLESFVHELRSSRVVRIRETADGDQSQNPSLTARGQTNPMATRQQAFGLTEQHPMNVMPPQRPDTAQQAILQMRRQQLLSQQAQLAVNNANINLGLQNLNTNAVLSRGTGFDRFGRRFANTQISDLSNPVSALGQDFDYRRLRQQMRQTTSASSFEANFSNGISTLPTYQSQTYGQPVPSNLVPRAPQEVIRATPGRSHRAGPMSSWAPHSYPPPAQTGRSGPRFDFDDVASLYQQSPLDRLASYVAPQRSSLSRRPSGPNTPRSPSLSSEIHYVPLNKKRTLEEEYSIVDITPPSSPDSPAYNLRVSTSTSRARTTANTSSAKKRKLTPKQAQKQKSVSTPPKPKSKKGSRSRRGRPRAVPTEENTDNQDHQEVSSRDVDVPGQTEKLGNMVLDQNDNT